jgi:maleate cis-trans isomerase
MAARVRLGVLVPAGNPTVEPEWYRMAPPGVTVHFARLDTPGAESITGSHDGMVERTRSYVDGMPAAARVLAAVNPSIIVFAHTGVSYVIGAEASAALPDRITALTGIPAMMASGGVKAALTQLGVKRLAIGTPYPASISELSRAYWTAAGFEIVGYHRLEGVQNIYEETEDRARDLARRADVPGADAVFLSGTGLPTVGALDGLEAELGKPVISGNQAAMWRALRLAGVRQSVPGFGRLLREL